MSYKIKNVGPSKSFNTKDGHSLTAWSVQFEGSEDWVEINQKPETAAPTVGQELEGTIEATQYGKRFKKAAGGFQGGRSDSPEQRASIERQCALKAAVEAVRDYHTFTGERPKDQAAYRVAVIAAAKDFAAHLQNVNPQTTVTPDLPPVEQLDLPEPFLGE